jgi:putative lipoprotein
MRAALGLLAAAALALCGCGQLDLSPEGDPSRVLVGEVALGDPAALPPDAVVTVRVVDASITGAPPQVLGSQTLRGPVSSPVAFRVEYRADDELLRRGLNVEVRVSYGGRVRYYNKSNFAVTLGNASETHRINVNPVGP